MRLNLKREYKGYYTNHNQNISIIVSEHEGNWTGEIIDTDEIEDDKYMIYVCYGDTKQNVVYQLIQYITQ